MLVTQCSVLLEQQQSSVNCHMRHSQHSKLSIGGQVNYHMQITFNWCSSQPAGAVHDVMLRHALQCLVGYQAYLTKYNLLESWSPCHTTTCASASGSRAIACNDTLCAGLLQWTVLSGMLVTRSNMSNNCLMSSPCCLLLFTTPCTAC